MAFHDIIMQPSPLWEGMPHETPSWLMHLLLLVLLLGKIPCFLCYHKYLLATLNFGAMAVDALHADTIPLCVGFIHNLWTCH